jgi:hypothetical protein
MDPSLHKQLRRAVRNKTEQRVGHLMGNRQARADSQPHSATDISMRAPYAANE